MRTCPSELSETCSDEQLDRLKDYAREDDLRRSKVFIVVVGLVITLLLLLVAFELGQNAAPVYFLLVDENMTFEQRHGWKWCEKAFMLFWFVTLLSPAFWYGVWLWVRNKRCLRNIKYGPKGRNYMDLYIPRHSTGKGKAPVVVFVTGGAWIIGYKLWVTYVTPLWNTADYRNFPQGVIGDMCDDVSACVDWVFDHVERYGGDLSNVSLVGAHIITLLMIERAEQEWKQRLIGKGESLPPTAGAVRTPAPARWRVGDIRRVVGISGPYDLSGDAGDKLHGRGLYKSVLSAIMNGDLTENSPTPRIKRIASQMRMIANSLGDGGSGDRLRDGRTRNWEDGVRGPGGQSQFKMPHVVLLHGMKDQTVSFATAQEFADSLKQAGVRVETKYYGEGTHTTPLIEDVFLRENRIMRDAILRIYDGGVEIGEERSAPSVILSPDLYSGCVWYPYPLVYLAKLCNPF